MDIFCELCPKRSSYRDKKVPKSHQFLFFHRDKVVQMYFKDLKMFGLGEQFLFGDFDHTTKQGFLIGDIYQWYISDIYHDLFQVNLFDFLTVSKHILWAKNSFEYLLKVVSRAAFTFVLIAKIEKSPGHLLVFGLKLPNSERWKTGSLLFLSNFKFEAKFKSLSSVKIKNL